MNTNGTDLNQHREEQTAEEGAITSLLFEENRWVNGQRIEISGSMFL